jgi:hypothetical protein
VTRHAVPSYGVSRNVVSEGETGGPERARLRSMGTTRYWSVEECCWREHVAPEQPAEETAVPQQRVDEPAVERVDA